MTSAVVAEVEDVEEERRSEGRWRPASSRDPPRDAVAGA